MSESDDEGQERERQLKIVIMGDGASGKVSFNMFNKEVILDLNILNC